MVSIGATATSSGLIIYMILVQSIGLLVEDAFLLLPLDPPLYVILFISITLNGQSTTR